MEQYHSRLPLDELFLSRLSISDPTSTPDRHLVREPRPHLPLARPDTKHNGESPSKADPIDLLPRWWKSLRGLVATSLILGLTLVAEASRYLM